MKKEGKKETSLFAVCILRIAQGQGCTRLTHAARIRRAFGPSDARDLWSGIKATMTHAAALFLTRNAFTTKFVNSLNAAKLRCPFLAEDPDRESTCDDGES